VLVVVVRVLILVGRGDRLPLGAANEGRSWQLMWVQLSAVLFVVTFIHDDRLVVVRCWMTMAMMRTMIMTAVVARSPMPVFLLLQASACRLVGLIVQSLRVSMSVTGVILHSWFVLVYVHVF
jgi:hypothetical protein